MLITSISNTNMGGGWKVYRRGNREVVWPSKCLQNNPTDLGWLGKLFMLTDGEDLERKLEVLLGCYFSFIASIFAALVAIYSEEPRR